MCCAIGWNGLSLARCRPPVYCAIGWNGPSLARCQSHVYCAIGWNGPLWVGEAPSYKTDPGTLGTEDLNRDMKRIPSVLVRFRASSWPFLFIPMRTLSQLAGIKSLAFRTEAMRVKNSESTVEDPVTRLVSYRKRAYEE